MMPRQDSRPVNLSLWHFRFPPNAILSITHRISGVVLSTSLIAWLLWLNIAFVSAENLASNQAWLSSLSGQLFLSLFWASLAFHWLAGVRHLLIEFSINAGFSNFLRTEQAVWLVLGLWIALSSFSLARIWL